MGCIIGLTGEDKPWVKMRHSCGMGRKTLDLASQGLGLASALTFAFLGTLGKLLNYPKSQTHHKQQPAMSTCVVKVILQLPIELLLVMRFH